MAYSGSIPADQMGPPKRIPSAYFKPKKDDEPSPPAEPATRRRKAPRKAAAKKG